VGGLATLFLTACLGWHDGANTPGGDLHWDGQYWALDGSRPVRTAQATVHLDFQSLLLLRLKVDRSITWLWLDKHTSPERWLDVRRALFASPTAADKTTGDSTQPDSSHSIAVAS